MLCLRPADRMDDGEKTTAAVLPDIMFVFQSSYKFPGFSMKIFIIFTREEDKESLEQLTKTTAENPVAHRLPKCI